MGKDKKIRFVPEGFVYQFHIIIHSRADPPAGCKEIFGYIDLAGYFLLGKRPAILRGKRKRPYIGNRGTAFFGEPRDNKG
jgi:hypothetical protein